MSLIIPSNSIVSGGYAVDNSVRLDGTSAYLKKTPTSAGNRQKWTWSGWVKRSSNFAAQQTLFGVSASSSTYHLLYFSGNDTITHNYQGTYIETNAKYRDPSAWYHIVLAVDTTQGTNTNRLKLYVNGTQVTSFSASGYPSQNTEMNINNTVQHDVANSGASYNHYINGYMAEVCFINNQQLDPTSFGEFDEDSGIWKPIDVSGLTFGTNGFYLDFENSAALGADVSGNTNNFTVNNLTAIDQSTDTCTNNFCVMNSLDGSQWQTLSEGNLKIVNSSAASSFGLTKGSIGVTKGKWYWEVKYTYGHAGHFGFFKVSNTAITNEEDINGNLYTVAGSAGNFTGVGFRISGGGDILEIEGNVDTNVDFSSGDTLGLAFDGDSGKLYAFKNGAELTGQDIGAGTSLMAAVTMDDIFLPFVSNGDGGSGTKTGTSEFNFGSPPYAISSGNQDGNGFGNFEYAVPSGYFSINTKNLAEHG